VKGNKAICHVPQPFYYHLLILDKFVINTPILPIVSGMWN